MPGVLLTLPVHWAPCLRAAPILPASFHGAAGRGPGAEASRLDGGPSGSVPGTNPEPPGGVAGLGGCQLGLVCPVMRGISAASLNLGFPIYEMGPCCCFSPEGAVRRR